MKFFDASRYASPLRKALAKKENAPRNLRFETLENRALLSVTPLDELQAAVASAEIAPAQTVETPVVDLSVLAVSNATTETNANDDQYEDNDSSGSAYPLTLSTPTTTIEAIAGSNREQDWYRVNFKYAGTADHYILLEKALDANVNLQLYLKKADGTSYRGEYSSASTKQISLEGVPAGEYLIQVYNQTNSSVYAPYTLTIAPPTPEADDRYENVADGVDNNDSFTNAYDLDMVGDLKLDAKAGPNHNPDYFKFTMVGTGTAQDQIKLSADANAYLNFRLYSANDTQTPISGKMTSEGSAVLSLKDLAAGDYYVFVDNNLTADSFVKYSLTFNAPKVAPAAPTNFKATENVSETTLKITKDETTLAWDAVENATYYEIRYTTDVDADNPTWSEIETVDGLSQEVSLAYATSYKYQVRAVTVFNDAVVTADTALEGAWTDLEFSTVAVLTAPTDLAVSKLDPETRKVTFTWSKVDDANEYVVLLSTADGQTQVTLPADATSWAPDVEFALGSSGSISITPANNAGVGGEAVLNFTVEDVPAQPTDLAATVLNPETLTVDLTWNDVAVNETGYVVETFVDGAWVAATEKTLAADATTWTTGKLEHGTTYAYRVAAVNDYGQSDWATVEFATSEAASTVVTTAEDVVDAYDGEISLREAIEYAESGDTITFADDVATITLAGSQLNVTKSLTIDGGENGVTVDANGKSRVFNLEAQDETVAIQNLTVTGGFTGGGGLIVGGGVGGGFLVPVNTNGAGVRVRPGTTATFTNVTIAGNHAADGGGVAVELDATATFTNVTIADNTANTGGGVSVHSQATATFTNVTIADNTAEIGGGGGVLVYDAATATFTNVTIVGNTAATGGGGAVRGAATFTNATIAGNKSRLGGVGGLENHGTLDLFNSVVAGNTAGNSGGNSGGVVRNTDGNIDGNLTNNGTANAYNTLSTFTEWTNADEEGVANYVYDETQPLFNDAENGDYALAAGSQAINKGNDAYLADEITTDLAGNPRFNGAVDLGAYENQLPFAPTDLAATVLNPETLTVDLTWNDVAGNETGYVVETFVDSAWVAATEETLAADATTWTTGKLELGTTYAYRVAAVNDYGQSDWATLEFTTENVPAQPIDLTANVDDALYATLTWTADADADATPATGYEVAIIDENGECQVVATLKADATEWTTAAPLAYASTYNYAVRAVNEYGVSTWIAVEFATPEAASTVVTTAEDVVNAYDGEISLREAIQYAEAGDTITFADDVETITLAGSQLNVTKSLTIDGGENGVTVDANGKSRVFYLDAANGTVALTNLTLTDGSTSYGDLGGAGVYVNGAATFTNVTIAENNAQYGEGAGVYVNGAATFTNVTIAGNNAQYGDFGGGGVYVNNGGSATFTDSKISENSNDFRGGAVYLGEAATVAFTDSKISGNTAEGDGGGLYVSSDATVAFTDSKISENIVTYRDGGGVCVCSGATAIFTNVEISDNAATYNGSAVNVANGGAATFANVTITGNTSKYGAALDISGTATLTNVTIAGNASKSGSALDIIGTATFTNVTIAGNTGANALYNAGTLNSYNSILVGNSSNALTNAGTANAYNTLSNFTEWTNADEEGVANYVYDATQPLFNDAENGDYTLAAGSQAINKGNDAYLADEITTDLAGNPRFNGAVDLGAYESQIPNAPVLTVPELTVETFVPGEQTVALTWTDVDFETGYVVETLVDGAWVAASELLDAGTTTWTTGKLELGATYSFRVVAKNDAGDGVSAEVTFKTPNVPTKPELSATVNASTQPTVTLNWTNKGETGYRVEIQAKDETGTYVWTTLAELGADVDYYTTDVQMGQTYYYRVVAVNAYGETASAHKRVAVGNVPTGPTNLTATGDAAFKATLTWTDAANDETGYRVELQTQNADGETVWETVANLAADAATWTTPDALTSGATYRVVAWNAYGDSVAAETTIALETASTVVTTLADEFDPLDGDISLREAIYYAQTGDVVTFAESLRGETITLSGAQLTVDKAITIQGFVDENGAPQLAIDADGKSRVFYVNAGGASKPVSLSGLKLVGGYATEGGAVYLGWGKAANFSNVELTGNEATYGGAVYARPSAVVSFENATLSGNKAAREGGAIYLFGTANLTDSTIVENEALNGGAFGVVSGGTLNVANGSLIGNVATNYGGGAFVRDGGTANFEGATLVDNQANSGGAARVDGAATFKSNVISENVATAYAGAVFVGKSGTATFVNDEIVDNTAKSGGALYVAGTATLTNATIADNQATNGAGAYVVSTGTADFRNAIIVDAVFGQSGSKLNAYNVLSSFVDWTNAATDKATQFVYDQNQPLFTDGGYALADGSQAIDKGADAYLDAEITTDLAGNPRFNRTVDLGAYESRAPLAPTGLEYEFNHDAKNVILTWTAVEGADAYVVEQLGADGEWTPVAPPVGNPETTETTWESGAFDFGTSHAFRVVAKNAYGSSVASDAVSFTIQDEPTVVTSLEDGDLNLLDGVTTLREALRFAQDGAEIVFAEDLRGGTITLTGGPLSIMEKEISVRGFVDETGAPELTIDGDHKDMVFVVSNTRASFFGLSVVNGYASYAKYGGGALGGGFCVDNANATFTNVDVIGCHADVCGGGIYIGSNVEAPGQGKSTLTNVRILDNVSDNGESSGLGGGLYATGGFMGGEIEMTNVEISGNQARVDGGGVFLNDITSTLTNVKITDNIAQGNGGAFYANAPDHTFTSNLTGYPLLLISTKLTNVEISGNKAYKGFGFYADEFDVEELSLRNVTLADNAGTQEGASGDVYLANGVATFYNSIVDGDVQGEEYAANAYNTLSSYTDWANATDDGVVNYEIDATKPLFADAENDDYALAVGSQALDKGDNAYVAETLTTDLAGNARIVNATVDLGAYESPETASTVVTTNADVVDAYDGEISIREALAYAKSGQTVTFAESLRGKTITLAGEELTIDKMLTIQGLVDENGAPQITIDADGKSRVFNINAGVASKPVNFSGLTITGGAATNGGAVYIAWDKAANFTNVELTDNEATYGGAVYVRPSAVVSFENATLSGNKAAREGGAIYLLGTANLTDSTIVENEALNGGAFGVVSGGTLNVANGSLIGNVATNYGGGAFVRDGGTANFEGATLVDNQANFGGAARVDGTATFKNNVISENAATAYAGAVFVGKSGTATFVNDEIVDNTAKSGGALYVAGTATLTNATIADNQAGNGAGAYVANGGTANFKDSTIEDAVVGNVVISDSSDETPISAAFADAFDELDFFVDEDELDALAQRLI